MSFNIRYDNPDDDDNAWPHRKEYVAKLILTNDDLIGTQEGLINQLEELDELLFQDKQVRYDRVGISWDGYED